MRSNIARRLLGVILGAGLAIAPLAVAQETKTEKTKAAKTESPATKAETPPKAASNPAKEASTKEASAKEAPGKAAPGKAKGRLPPQYGKLNLTDAQRDQIYAIQGRFKEQIEQLEKQLKEAQAKEDTEIEGVLTAEQKTQLDALLEAAQQKKAAAKAKPTDAKPTDAKPVSGAE